MFLDTLQEVLIQTATQKKNITYCVWGKHGIGKSQAVEQVAKALNYGFRNVRLSQIDPTELIGYPNKKSETITYEDGKTETIEYLDYSPPKWFVDALKGNYVIFLDELNRAKKDVQQAAFELVNERTLNGRKLPDSVLIIAACNPFSDKYDTIEFDEALIDRFCHILAQSNFEVWTDWAKTKNAITNRQRISNDIISFLATDKSRQSFDFVEAQDREFPVKCTPSPRAWSRANEVYGLNLPMETKKELMNGVLGMELALNFFNSLSSSKKPITLDELLLMNPKNPEDEIVKKIKSYSQVDLINVDTDSFNSTEEVNVEIAALDMTCSDLCREENEQFVVENMINVLTFLTLIPAALSQKTVSLLLKKTDIKKVLEKELSKTQSGKKLENLEEEDKNDPLVWHRLVYNLHQLHLARRSMKNPILSQKK